MHHHDGADARLRADAQAAAVQLGQRAGDGEAETGALVALRELGLDLLEGPAELAERVLRDADAGVLDKDVDGVAGKPRAHRDAAALGRELHRVVEEVDEDLVQRALVGRHGGVGQRVDRELERSSARALADELQRLVERGLDARSRFVEPTRPASIRDMSRMSLMTERRYCPLERMSRQYSPYFSRAERAEHAALHHLGEADDGVERRAQLVAHVGQELGLGAVRALGLRLLLEVALGEVGELLRLRLQRLARLLEVGRPSR